MMRLLTGWASALRISSSQFFKALLNLRILKKLIPIIIGLVKRSSPNHKKPIGITRIARSFTTTFPFTAEL